MVLLSSFLLPWLMLSLDPDRMDRLAQLSIEELISLKVVSAEKTERAYPESAAAVFVVSREDIERSGTTQLAELLRFVPGVQVARLSVNVWAVSIRGFNELHANKLLVMIDGRPIYNHLFSGVFWPMFEMSTDEIERIEVIRGPGSTLWGANAVNGIINIISRTSEDAQGVFVGLGTGHQEKAFGDARYGFRLGPQTTARVNYGFAEREMEDVRLGPNLLSDERMQDGRVSMRLDHRFNNRASLLVQGNYFRNFMRRPSLPADFQLDDNGWFVQARFEHTDARSVKRSVQLYADSASREGEFRWHVWDLDFKEQRQLGRHHLVYGVGFRTIDDNVTRGLAGGLTFAPQMSNEKIGNLFVQDRIDFRENWSLTMGYKLEFNDFTDSEFQPNVRLHWAPPGPAALNLWAAASRAVHVPSRLERDGDTLPRPGPPLPRVLGNPDLDISYVTAYELGLRSRLGSKFWLDTAFFFNDYANEIAFEATGPPNQFIRVNGMEAETYGMDGSLEYRPKPWLRFAASFTVLEADFTVLPGPRPRRPLASFYEGQSPSRQWNLRSYVNLARGLTLDLHWRYLGAVRQAALANPAAPPRQTFPSYENLDVHVAWQLPRGFRAELVGRDLLGEHRELSFFEHEPQLHIDFKFWF
ncbi:TonB-dependent receptor plug domain-containing protein [Acanthopleuribacter pedis]|uniref:TonB-dependent receptor n=1 Tax=Acanthopleuribacter pedis TaxID=442870 RepID=A0A8J7Q759_9BACT|nr:TonB-dependent receptor [Acanthopleuribacter pedis]MBO1321847.1 TonB-dependent receptor [Acanthopleuribacter pedis]